VLFNLLGNAIKFTKIGEVVLRVERQEHADGHVGLHFSVRDTGIGIPAERQSSIFDAFTQADSSTTRKYGGTGLGLTITSQLVKLMGGRIWVESESGQGSTFHFTSNFDPGQTQHLVMPALEPMDLHNLSVMVVDDNQTNRRFLKEIMLQWGMRATTAEGGHEALAILEHAQKAGTPFALVLTDMQMPVMDGFGLVERIKQNPALAEATIMMLTSVGERGDGYRCRQLGVKAYLTKPITPADLRRAIEAALRMEKSDKASQKLVTRHSLRETDQRLRILLAEDNPVNQVLATRLLERRGHTVVVANNGREAMAALETQTFDIALMDVQMPEMDGFETTQSIREKERASGHHLPIIALTAHAMKGDEERCLAGGMDGYLTKPLQAKELFAIIEKFAPGNSGPEVRPALEQASSTKIV
ncbi:MAG: response regulator, partial [Candidatus Angelobacter sp.]